MYAVYMYMYVYVYHVFLHNSMDLMNWDFFMQWLKEQAIVEKLVDFVHPSADPEVCA